ncbi:hypothetical protein J113_19555 [Mycobacterium tuberculosis CAS/NITR204]|uniref:DUF1802 family protein n=2 Tax=Mycobacterium tuberculosis complex TaxID=77643 RepID=R4MBM0_MYCTX|nr:hypothetical protein J113_19555 [Mycobacterium tuberculosis CAS/NITR204]
MELPGAKRLGDDRRPLGTLRCWRHSDIGPARGIVVTPALKEWSAAVHALLDGRQTVLLRKGGIGEKRFEVAAHEFLLFPTVAHSHAERVRPEHRDLLGPAAADSTDECVLLRAAAKVVAALPVNRPEGLDAIEDLHIWTAESVRADRLDFRPKHKLAVLVVSAIPLAEPVRLAVADGQHQLGAAAGDADVGGAGARRGRAGRGRRPGPRGRGLTGRHRLGLSCTPSRRCE